MNDSACLVQDCDLISNNSESITINSTESRHKSISDDDNDGDGDDGKQQTTLDQFNALITINATVDDDDDDHNHVKGDDNDDVDGGDQLSLNILGETSRVSFPDDDRLITGYLEPANPWEQAHGVTLESLLKAYEESCEKHGSIPLKNVISQLEKLDLTSNNERHPELSLKNEELTKATSEPLEEIFRRLQFIKIDLESSGLDDESAETLFDIFEYYESAKHVNISHNGNIGARGWLACGLMIKRTLCLEQLDIRDIVLTQQHMNILKRPLQFAAHLQTLKLENCGLAGRAFVILAAALKVCTGLKELHLADNNLAKCDAVLLGGMLKINHHLQLLDVSNNNLQDGGVKEILKGLIAQAIEEHNEARGLGVLILWNNHFGRDSSDVFSDVLTHSKTLETLNIGQNAMGDEFLEVCKNSLRRNQTLLQLGVQSTGLISKGILALAEIIEMNDTLERIDLRDNNLQLTGLTFLSLALKKNTSVTRIDLDEKAISKIPAMADQYLELINEIRGYCERNEELHDKDSSTSESTSPEHRSRVSSVSSRKISLTCQTLPARSPPLTGTTSEVIAVGTTKTSSSLPSTSTMQTAKRTTGGRLRSPAPSPIPSPVASPIPSPSRNRFVVSRVSETSLSSTNSSASSSPVTPPPSFSSSPTISSSPSSASSTSTCFFPPDGSRFRVTIVTPALKINETEFTDSDDSDSVFVNQPSVRPEIRPTIVEKPLELNFEPSKIDSEPQSNLPTLSPEEIDNLSEMRLESVTKVPDLSTEDSELNITTIKSSFTTEITPNFKTDIITPTFKSEIIIPTLSTESNLNLSDCTDSTLPTVEFRPDETLIRPNVLNEFIESNLVEMNQSKEAIMHTQSKETIVNLGQSGETIIPTQSKEAIMPTQSKETIVRLTQSEENIIPTQSTETIVNLGQSKETIVNLTQSKEAIMPTQFKEAMMATQSNEAIVRLTESKESIKTLRPESSEERLDSNDLRLSELEIELEESSQSNERLIDLSDSNEYKNSSAVPTDGKEYSSSTLPTRESKLDTRPVTLTEQSIVESRAQSSQSSNPSSSLDRLLSLFQNPGSLFTASAFEPTVYNNTSPFSHVSSMMALGDRFQKFLREGLIDSNDKCKKESSDCAFKGSKVPVEDNNHLKNDLTLPMTLNVTNCDNTNISINHPNLINNDTHLLSNLTCDISVNNLLDDITVDKDHNNILVDDSNDLLHPEVEIIYEHCESFDDHQNSNLIENNDEEASFSQNLLIDRSVDRSVAHRNSQDSGIEETNTCEDNLDGFAGSLDSGIESECSSVCVKTDEIVNDEADDIARDGGVNDNDNNDDERRLEEIKKAFNIPVSNNDDDICSNS
ncbi:serine-rich adhesin for platelets isoform X2 [Cotesia glomerata]|uniref:serine-rich adhesin for platelets isoform X2 n=1 Tax=Cotesia glomerata TaxID=32391 RepID=UPI001D00C28D|nr:serine-rich adhesin for platelets isoform X2 [Cotesia glomerata]